MQAYRQETHFLLPNFILHETPQRPEFAEKALVTYRHWQQLTNYKTAAQSLEIVQDCCILVLVLRTFSQKNSCNVTFHFLHIISIVHCCHLLELLHAHVHTMNLFFRFQALQTALNMMQWWNVRDEMFPSCSLSHHLLLGKRDWGRKRKQEQYCSLFITTAARVPVQNLLWCMSNLKDLTFDLCQHNSSPS